MKVSAHLKNASVAERKARLVADLVRGASLRDAERQLRFSSKKSAGLILGLIRSAAANAEHNENIERDSLRVAEITVDGAGFFKRYQPRAYGRAYQIRRRRSHISVVLEGEKAPEKKKAKKPASKKPATSAKKPAAKKADSSKKTNS